MSRAIALAGIKPAPIDAAQIDKLSVVDVHVAWPSLECEHWIFEPGCVHCDARIVALRAHHADGDERERSERIRRVCESARAARVASNEALIAYHAAAARDMRARGTGR